MPVELPLRGQEPKKEWTVTGRFVLVSIVLFFLVVASVNALMMTLAIRTFPGADARNGYDASQNYNREIAASREQHDRGWVSDITFVRDAEKAKLSVALHAKDGQPVTGLRIIADLAHPSDKRKDHRAELNEVRPGIYEALEGGLAAGAWGLTITGTKGDERVYLARARATLG
jgi:nitrogen fixation protein FixH